MPEDLNVIATYPIAVVNDAPNPELAAAFVDYVTGPDGQATLVEYGFDAAARPA
ncbi:MAG TPA: extracellular solute-binding protein [Actinomycetota bacterium]|nr:extracellular solute-binding protein [Actinomycetota bacterium]